MTASQRRVGVVLHQYRSEIRELSRRTLDWCSAHGHLAVLPVDDAELIGRPDLGVVESSFATDLDLCVSLGGDGTMLRATRLVGHVGVPLLGVNAGQLGYLTEIDPEHLEAVLDDWQAGRLRAEPRMLLEISIEGADPSAPTFALNEVVLERADSGHTVSVIATIDGRRFTRYLADGLIIATPTGSTAYSLSAGGPIVDPTFEALVLSPVAAHMVFDRSLVLAPTSEIRLTVDGYRAGVVTVDGRQVARLEPGESVVCRGGRRQATFLVRGDRDFHTILREKFGLSDR